ncbi:uncharacterized protein LOC141908101 [Tubulanus polymorphus]|uniref:uncharacterized protein LOC141908101 n=1 Tax=Tubulanus polymorphus TaxID=672921 RepID=UPI003DA35315
MSKSKVAPVKPITIPRLELLASLVTARLADHLMSSLKSRIPRLICVLWSDNQAVLTWIMSPHNMKLDRFVSNRIAEIKRLTGNFQWRYCPSSDNPADIVSRGSNLRCLQDSKLWWHGPEWLPNEELWPKWTISNNSRDSCEIPSTEDCFLSTNSVVSIPESGLSVVIDMSRYSSLNRLKRITAWIYRFINNVKDTTNRKTGGLTARELKFAELQWMKDSQRASYSTVLSDLVNGRKSKQQIVGQLQLRLDDNSLIRVGGRIDNSTMADSAKFPILLPKNHFTELYVRPNHIDCVEHLATNSTIAAIRQNVWITQIRPFVKRLLKNCLPCRKQNARCFGAPETPPLPWFRVKEQLPFETTGVDLTGHFNVKTQAGVIKCYICLFTCAVTRGVHLELVMDNSTESFIRALRRFAGRRSQPSLILSDNASNFVGASKELDDLFKTELLQDYLSTKGIIWKRIPKKSPWFGGFWERLIGVTKSCLKKVMGRSLVTYDEFMTLLIEIEAAINDRPLTSVSDDINDFEPITPSALMMGRRITSLPEPFVRDDQVTDPDYEPTPGLLSKRASKLALLLKHFWIRWKTEYLTSLREYYSKTSKSGNVIKIGSVVLIHDSDQPRIKWKSALVTNLLPGRDGLVRVANLKTANGHTNRPVTRLVPLEINADPDFACSCESKDDNNVVNSDNETGLAVRPTRKAAIEAKTRISEILKMD